MTTLAILKAARAKIERPECWTKGAPARDASGREVLPFSPSATSYCAIGAVLAAQGYIGWTRSSAEDALFKAVSQGNRLGRSNDEPETTHADVLALFDRAIADAAHDANPSPA